ncbi:MAG: hypothetical protein VYC17_02095 [Nitrospinota bacterium]|nr:hypothetical protein [Nitrospinota bacterium]
MFLVFVRFFFILVGVLFLNVASSLANTQSKVPGDFLTEAKRLYTMEMDYFQKRLDSDWQGIYDYHHPTFKKNIPLVEFKFFQGRVVYNYRDVERQHVSGLRIPSREYIKNNPAKKDILGFPIPVKFEYFGDPLLTPEKLSIKKFIISRDKQFAKVETQIKGKQKLNPAIIHGNKLISFNVKVIDYWEKVDGRWVITLLRDTISMSGVSKFYYIPNNNDHWEKMEFVSIDAYQAAPDEH